MSNSFIQQFQDEITLSSSTNNMQYSYDTIKKGDKNQQQNAHNINGQINAIYRPHISSLLNKDQDTSNSQQQVEQNDNVNQIQKSEGDIVLLSSSNNLKQSCYEIIQEGDKDQQQQVIQNVNNLFQDKNKPDMSSLLNKEKDPSNSHQEVSQNSAIFNQMESPINHKKDKNTDSAQSKVSEETKQGAVNQWSIQYFNNLNPKLDERFKLYQDQIFREFKQKYCYLEDFLAKGGEGYIFKGFIQQQGNIKEEVVFKIIISQDEFEIKEEIEILKIFEDQRNVIKHIGNFSFRSQNDHMYIHVLILEKCKYSLEKELQDIQNKKQDFSAVQLFKMILELLDGLMQFRMYNVLHLDIKPANILITQNGDYIFTDFGLSQSKKKNQEIRIKGYTQKYAPKEQLDDKPEQLDYRSDIYSLGKTIEDILHVFERIKQNYEIISYIEENIVEKMTCEQQENRQKCEDSHKKLIFELVYGKFRIYSTFLESYFVKVKTNFHYENFDNNINTSYYLNLKLYYTLIELDILLQKLIRAQNFCNTTIFNQNDSNGLIQLCLLGDFYKKKDLFHVSNLIALNLNRIGEYYSILESYQKALKYFLESHKMRKEILEENDFSKDKSLHNIGKCYMNIGDNKKASSYYQELIKRRKLFKSNTIQNSIYFIFIGSYFLRIRNNQIALNFFQKALRLIQKLYNNHPLIPQLLNNIGVCFTNLGDFQYGLKYVKISLDLKKQQFKGNNFETAKYLYNIGRNCLAIGEIEKAKNYLEQSLKMKQELYLENHSSTIETLSLLGQVYLELGNSEKAFTYLFDSVIIHRQSQKENNLATITNSIQIGLLYSQLGDYETALTVYFDCLKLCQQLEKHPCLANLLNNIGKCYSELGEYENALNLFFESLKMKRRIIQSNYPDIAISLFDIGRIYFKQGDYQKALRYLFKLLKIYREFTKKGHHLEIAEILNVIGICYSYVKDNKMALKYLCDSLNMKKNLQKIGDFDIAESLNNIGVIYYSTGDLLNALRSLTQSEDIQSQLLIRNQLNFNASKQQIEQCKNENLLYDLLCLHSMKIMLLTEKYLYYSTTLNYIGLCFQKLGDNEESLINFRDSHKLRRLSLGNYHLSYAMSLKEIGLSYRKIGDYQKAQNYLLDSLEIRKQLIEGNHISIVQSLYYVGICYRKMKDHIIALDYLLDSFQMNCQLLQGDHNLMANCLRKIGYLYFELGDKEKSLNYFLCLLKIRKQLFKGNHPEIANSLNDVGLFYKNIEYYEKGLNFLLDSLQMSQQLKQGNHKALAKQLNDIGSCYRGIGDNTIAQIYFQDSKKMEKKQSKK